MRYVFTAQITVESDDVITAQGIADEIASLFEWTSGCHSVDCAVQETVKVEPMDNDMIEHCDVCHRPLDKLKGEDFYDEGRGAVTCAEHWAPSVAP